MDVVAAAVLGLVVVVGFGVLVDLVNRAQDSVNALRIDLERQEQARVKRHDETLEALKARRRA